MVTFPTGVIQHAAVLVLKHLYKALVLLSLAFGPGTFLAPDRP